jgi:membrane protein DedA with SNARE-associated domain
MALLFQSFLGPLLVYRYAALFVITFLGSLGFPVPAAPSTIAASAFAGQGYFNLFWVMVSGSLGNIGGDVTMYWLVRRYGKKVLQWFRLKSLAESPALLNVEATVETYKAPVIIISRFQVQATALVNVIAGLGRMDFKRFFWLVVGGEILQMAFYVAIGYVFADSWQALYDAVGKFGWIIALALAVVITMASTKIIEKKFR